MTISAMPSGRTHRAELGHKLRGAAQVCTDLLGEFPKSGTAIIIVLGAIMIGVTWHTYDHDRNPRILRGSELALASEAFNSIRTADTLADDFSKSGIRPRALTEAALSLAKFQGGARTKEGNRAATVMAYYLDEVRKVTQADIDLAHARYEANKKDYKILETNAPYDDLDLIQTAIPYFQYEQERFDAERVLRICRNESMSYVFPGHQPPVDACLYTHDVPTVDRK